MKLRLLSFLFGALAFATQAAAAGGAPALQSNTVPVRASSSYFPSEDVGYVGLSDGQILKTTDGGATWAPTLAVDFATNPFVSLFFVNDDEGYAGAGSDLSPAAEGFLLKTLDGGATWTAVAHPWDQNQGEADLDRVSFTAMHWFDANTGLVATERDIDAFLAGSPAKEASIWRTTDGGATWTEVNNMTYGDGDGATVAYNAFGFAKDNVTGYLVGEKGAILTTTDGGITWTDLTNMAFVEGDNGEPDHQDILVLSPDRIYIGSDDGLLLTTDGFTTFTNVLPVNGFDGVTGVGLIGTDIIVAIAEGTFAVNFERGNGTWVVDNTTYSGRMNALSTVGERYYFAERVFNPEVNTVYGESICDTFTPSVNSETIQVTPNPDGDNPLEYGFVIGSEVAVDGAYLWEYTAGNSSEVIGTDTGTNEKFVFPAQGDYDITLEVAGVCVLSTSINIGGYTVGGSFLSDDIIDMFWVNDNLGWATGQDATLYKTVDAGETWTLETSNADVVADGTIPYDSDFWSVYFVDENVGYVSAIARSNDRGGFILKTTDGGATWTRLSHPLTSAGVDPENDDRVNFYTLWFTDANTGFVTYQNNVNQAGNTADINTGWTNGVYKTTDGGATWTEVAKLNLENFVAFNEMVFVNPNDGFIVGGWNTILTTADGGDSWSVVRTGSGSEFLYDLHMLSPTAGYVVGRNIVELTSDGFQTVTPVIPGFSGTVRSIDISNTTGNVYFGTTNEDLWVSVDGGFNFTNYENYATDDINEVKTRNGFVHLGLADGFFAKIDECDFNVLPEPEVTITVTDLEIAAEIVNPEAGFTYELTEIAGVAQTGTSGTVTVASAGVYEVDVTVSNACGSDRFTFTTSVGAVEALVPAVGLNNIDFVDENTGYIAADEAVMFKTIDGGATWTTVLDGTEAFLPGANDLWDVDFVDADNGYATAIVDFGGNPNGFLLKTTDGGATWTALENLPILVNDPEGDDRVQFYTIEFSDANTGFLSTQRVIDSDFSATNNQIWKTEDGGATWQLKASFNFGEFVVWQDMTFVDNFGILVGGRERVVITNDGGETWTDVTVAANENKIYYDVYADASGKVMIAGNDRVIVSDDFYVNSTQPIAAFDGRAYGIVSYDADTYVLTVENGVNYYTTDGGATWALMDPFITDANDIFKSELVGSNYIGITSQGGVIVLPSCDLIPAPTFSTNVTTTADANDPLTYSIEAGVDDATAIDVDFGDGNTATDVTLPVTNTYVQLADETVYTVTVTASNVCGSASAEGSVTIEALPVGVEELSQLGISVFPVPASTRLQVSSQEHAGEFVITLTDVRGVSVARYQVSGQLEQTLDLTGLSSGIYLLNVAGDELNASSRIVVR